MKRLPEEKPDGAPEWMVSFADMITIMMSFFVIMFALASADKGKRNEQRGKVLESLEYRFGPKWKPFASWVAPSGRPSSKDGGDKIIIKQPNESPSESDTPQIQNKQPTRIMIPRLGEQLAIGGSVLFEDESADLNDTHRAKLRAVSEELAGKPQQIEILGHASARPLIDSTCADRWELAFLRCRHIADALESLGIDRTRIRMAVGRNAGLRTPGTGPSLEGTDSRVDIYLTNRILQREDEFVRE